MVDFPGPEEPTPPFGRKRHPFFMHEMIRRQAVASRATRRSIRELLETTPIAPPERRLLCVGLGTSYHAALATAHAASLAWGDRCEAAAVTSFDLLQEPQRAGPGTTAIVFSAGGGTALTLQAQELLRTCKVPTVLITTEEAGRSVALADRVLLSPYSQEASWTHTVSFTSALVSAGTLLEHWTPGAASPPASEDEVSELVTGALACEPQVLDLVDPLAERDRLLIVGSGSAEASAREGALKLREAAGRFCAAVGVEELLHGVLPSVGARTGVLAISGTEVERTRALQGLEAARLLGARTVLFDSSGGPGGPDIVALPKVPPPMPPVVQVIPLQLLAYWAAVSEGRNPDVMGLDDPRVLTARKSFGI
ncbi:MAG: SIS domain-containing protein [Thermoplasmata archaeon]|nr:SIS domain-containing protein [Thermoplasmata archaeon]